MFEPTTFGERRSNLNETMMHRMLAVQLRLGQKLQNPALRRDAQGNLQTELQCHQEANEQLQYHFQDYSRRSQQLRDLHAAEVLGPVVEKEGETLVDVPLLIDLIKNNLGKAWFLGAENASTAADGTVGTAGFGKKYKDWVESLPDLDASMTDDIQSGFYKDGLSGIGIPVAALVIRYGDEVISIIFTGQFGASVVNLAHTKLRQGALRSEQYSYRQNVPQSVFAHEFAKALTAAGVADTYQFALPVKHDVVVETAGEGEVVVDGATVEPTERAVYVATEGGREGDAPIIQVDEAGHTAPSAAWMHSEPETKSHGIVDDSVTEAPAEEQPWHQQKEQQ